MSKAPIAILHYAAPPTIGGVEATIGAHARVLADHGYSVTVIAGSGESVDPRVRFFLIPEAASGSPSVLALNAQLARGNVPSELEQLASSLVEQITRALPEDGITTVIAHNVASLHKNLALTIALWRLAETHTIRLIAWCHDFAWADPQYAGDVHPGMPWELLCEPWSGVRYVVVSEARKQELKALWEARGRASPHEIAVVPPGVAPFEFLAISPWVEQWAREYTLLDAEPLLLVPARLTRRKRIEYAIEITAALANLGLNPKLVVTGPPGPHNPTNAAYLARLRSLRDELDLGDRVIFLHEKSAVSQTMMRDLYLLSDALLFPSEREGFGIPLLEAGLTRLPVFCTDLAPFREIAGDRAYYIPAQSPEMAAALISETLAQNPAYCFKRHVLTTFAWDHIFAERIEPLLR